MNTTLLVLAAGMGSRYGGMKQLDHLGPSGETIMDYSVYDALEAGFDKIVFVIRHSFEEQFRELFVKKLQDKAEIRLAFQEMDNIPVKADYPEERSKPWGTAHAVWVAKDQVSEPFAMINADDFYGRQSFQVMADFLRSLSYQDQGKYGMVGYKLHNTLSAHGTVSRGVCTTIGNTLEKVEEHTSISKDASGKVMNIQNGQTRFLSPDATASMNFWGFTPDIFEHLEAMLIDFLKIHAREMKSEYYIPFVVDELIRQGKATVEVLHSDAKWFGVTYYQDKFMAMERIDDLVKSGKYPKRLWGAR